VAQSQSGSGCLEEGEKVEGNYRGRGEPSSWQTVELAGSRAEEQPSTAAVGQPGSGRHLHRRVHREDRQHTSSTHQGAYYQEALKKTTGFRALSALLTNKDAALGAVVARLSWTYAGVIRSSSASTCAASRRLWRTRASTQKWPPVSACFLAPSLDITPRQPLTTNC
jgi:hypothetical protein